MTVYKSNNESSRNQRDLHYVNDAERRSKQRNANFQRVGEHTTKIYIDKKYETQSWSQSQQRKNPKIESFRTAPATPNRRPIYDVENTAQAASQRRRRVYTVEGPELIADAGRRSQSASQSARHSQPNSQNTRRTQAQQTNRNQSASRTQSQHTRRTQAQSTRGKQKRNPKKKQKASGGRIVLRIVLIVLIALVVWAGIEIITAKSHASSIKSNLKTVIECAKEGDGERAEKATANIRKHTDALNNQLNDVFWSFVGILPGMSAELNPSKEILKAVSDVEDKILPDLPATIQKYPLSQMKIGDGFNVGMMSAYLGLLEKAQPELNRTVEALQKLPENSLVGKALLGDGGKLTEAIDLMEHLEDALPLMITFLGHGEDRLYLLAAQNSTEIRASGGFPGSMGVVQIKDGVMTIGDFNSVYQVLKLSISERSGIEPEDVQIFGDWLGNPHDACFMADFKKAGKVWSVAYEERQAEENNNPGVHVDGVISMTPAIIQKMLAVMGEITLSDGTVLNGENAVRVLQHELYVKYYSKDTYSESSNDMADMLFAETAKTVMSNFVSSFEISKLLDFYQLIMEGIDEHIIFLWMEDEAEEQVIEKIGADGSLNHDPNAPFTGIYFSLADPSKLGWYLDIVPEISNMTENADGSKTYDVEVSLMNRLTYEEAADLHEYIIGSINGAIYCYVQCFAPAGGTIDNVWMSGQDVMMESTYHDLGVAYNLDLTIDPNDSATIHYQITTAPGVDVPLKAITTPTLTQYR